MSHDDEAILAPGPRRMIALGGALLIVGLAMVGVGPSDVGSGVTLIALALLVLGIHRLGRLGPPR
jgi:dipeptide/tripeptide permease